MEQERLQHLEKRLKTRRRELVERRERLEESRMNLKQDHPEVEERAANQQLAGGLEQLDERGEETIAAINHALNRMEEGEYHLCEVCGEPIAPARLEAVPWTSMCVDCAEKAEGRA